MRHIYIAGMVAIYGMIYFMISLFIGFWGGGVLVIKWHNAGKLRK